MMWTIEGLTQAISDAHERRAAAVADRDYHDRERMAAHIAVIDAERDIRRLETELIVAGGEPS